MQPCISLSLSEKLLNLNSEGRHLRWPDLSAAGVFRKVLCWWWPKRGDVSALVMWVLNELPLESEQPTHSHALHSISPAPDILLHYTTPLIYMKSETGSTQAPRWTPTEQKWDTNTLNPSFPFKQS